MCTFRFGPGHMYCEARIWAFVHSWWQLNLQPAHELGPAMHGYIHTYTDK